MGWTRIEIRQKRYAGGETIEGFIKLNASQGLLCTQGRGRGRKLVIQAVAKMKASIVVGSGQSESTFKEKKFAVSNEVEVASFPRGVPAGTHTYAFSLGLPPAMPPTMKGGKNVGSSFTRGHGCMISCKLKARLQSVSSKSSSSASEREIIVYLKAPTDRPTPVMVGPSSAVVRNSFFNSRQGSISLGFNADRSVVGRNGSVGLTVATVNNSPFAIRAMVIKIKETVAWRVKHSTLFSSGAAKNGKVKKTIATVKVSGSNLGGMQHPTKARTTRPLENCIVAAEGDIRRALENGPGGRPGSIRPIVIGIQIPTTCRDTFDSEEIIKVTHWLCVSLKKAGRDVKVKMHLRVQGVV